MFKRLAAAGLVLCLGTQARALTIAGWDTTPAPDKDNQCSIQHTYKDANDKNAANTIVLVFGKDDNGSPIMSLTFGYENWHMTKGNTEVGDLLVDDTVEQRKITWTAAAPNIYTTLFSKPGELIDAMAYGKTLAIRFGPTAEARFQTPSIGMALGGAQVCRSLMK